MSASVGFSEEKIRSQENPYSGMEISGFFGRKNPLPRESIQCYGNQWDFRNEKSAPKRIHTAVRKSVEFSEEKSAPEQNHFRVTEKVEFLDLPC